METSEFIREFILNISVSLISSIILEEIKNNRELGNVEVVTSQKIDKNTIFYWITALLTALWIITLILCRYFAL